MLCIYFIHTLYDRLNTLKDCIFDTKRSSNEVKNDIQDILKKQEDGLRFNRALNQHKNKLLELESKIMQQKKTNNVLAQRAKDTKERIESIKKQLKQSMIRCKSGFENIQENGVILANNIKMRHTMFQALNRRRKELIADLFCIYPIEQVKPLIVNEYLFFDIKISPMMIRNSFIYEVFVYQIQAMMAKMMNPLQLP